MQPIFVLPESALKSTSKNVQRANIAAGKAVADAVKSTLGPKGMDKLLVSSIGDVTITNDGVTILEEMDIDHPVAKMVVEIAKVQEAEIGDGTTTAVILGGELLKQAENLLDKNIHPTVICEGYKRATQKAQEILQELAEKINIKDAEILKKIAITAMTGKNAGAKDQLADIAVRAVLHILEEENGEKSVDIKNNIKIEKKEGKGSEDTELIEGLVLDKDFVHPDMPKKVRNAKIALLDEALEIKETEIDAKIQITDPNQLQAFLEQEDRFLKNLVEKIAASGANVVFCEKGIDDLAQHYLAKKKIAAVRRVAKDDMEKLARASGGRIVSKINELEAKDLGSAGLVEEKKLAGESMVFVEKCRNPKAVSILVRGGTEHVVDEVERAIKDALGDIAAAVISGKCVAGGGAAEMELARQIRSFAAGLAGREQLAVQAFADTLEIIPRTLAENAGLDPIDMLTELKAKHDAGEKWAGLDVFGNKVRDLWVAGVIEPLKIKTQAIQSASEVAIMLLRIDDVVSSGRKEGLPPGPAQM